MWIIARVSVNYKVSKCVDMVCEIYVCVERNVSGYDKVCGQRLNIILALCGVWILDNPQRKLWFLLFT